MPVSPVASPSALVPVRLPIAGALVPVDSSPLCPAGLRCPWRSSRAVTPVDSVTGRARLVSPLALVPVGLVVVAVARPGVVVGSSSSEPSPARSCRADARAVVARPGSPERSAPRAAASRHRKASPRASARPASDAGSSSTAASSARRRWAFRPLPAAFVLSSSSSSCGSSHIPETRAAQDHAAYLTWGRGLTSLGTYYVKFKGMTKGKVKRRRPSLTRLGWRATIGSRLSATSAARGPLGGGGGEHLVDQLGEIGAGRGREAAPAASGAGESGRSDRARSRALLAREGPLAGDRMEQRRAEAPDVGGRAHRLPRLGDALLRGHVGVCADRAAALRGALQRPGDREVDEAGWHAHDDVVGLDVEVDVAGLLHVVERARDVQRERQELLGRKRAAAAEQPSQRRPSRCSMITWGCSPSSTASKPRTITGWASRRAARPPRRARASARSFSPGRGAAAWRRRSRACARPRPGRPRSGCRRRGP